MSLRAAAAWACARPLQIVAGYAASGLLFRLRTEELATAAERLRWLRWTAARLACCGAALALRDAPAFRAVVLVVGVFATYAHNARGRSPTARRAAPGTVALVTGATAGIGLATAVALCRRGVDVVVPGRSPERAAAAAARINAAARGPGRARALPGVGLELDDRASVRGYAAAAAAAAPDLALLVLNAGVMRPAYGVVGGGAEATVASNHLGHFLLAELLGPTLAANAARGRDCRVVVVSSSLHRVAARALDALPDAAARRAAVTDLRGDARAYGLFPRYALSKLMNVLHARALARRRPTVAAIAVHPGCVYTDVTRSLPWPVRAAHALAVPCWLLFQKLPPHGAHATVHAALAPELAAAENAGRSPYVADCRAEAPGLPRDADALADALWGASAAYAGAG